MYLIKTNKKRNKNHPIPPPINEDPLNKHVSHAKFRDVFTTLANSVASQNNQQAAIPAILVANTAVARIRDFTRMNISLFLGSKSD